MQRATIHISMPEAVRLYVEKRVEEANYGSVSEYFRELIRDDRQRQLTRLQMMGRAQAASMPRFGRTASSGNRQK